MNKTNLLTKMLLLAVMLVGSVSASWADTQTIFFADAIATSNQSFSNGTTEITSAQATITGGKMYAISGQNDAKELITKNGEFRMTNNNTIFKIELSTALAVGDVITAKSHGGVKNSENKGLWVTTSEDRPESAPACSAAAETPTSMTANFLNYTVTEDDGYVGATTLYIHRAAGATQDFDEFKVARADSRTTATLTFASTSGSVDIAEEESFTLPTLTKNPADATVTYSSSNTSVATVNESTGAVTLVAAGTTVITATFEGNETYTSATAEFTLTVTNSDIKIVGYTEAINGTTLEARALTGIDDLITISGPIYGSNILDKAGTSQTVYIDGKTYTNTDCWRKSQNGTYEGQNVGYQLTVASGYKMNISHVGARIAIVDDTSYSWYVEILNSAGTQVWKSGEKTTKRASSGVVDANVTDKTAIQGLTGTVTVNLWVKQSGTTKYYSINYLQLQVDTEVDERNTYTITANVAEGQEAYGSIDKDGDNSVPEGDNISLTATANPGYAFVNWTKDDVEVSTEATLALTDVTANATYVANFKKLYKATYDLGEYAGTITGKVLCTYNAGNSINEIYADRNDSYTIPAYAHKYLYREGYTFAGWSCGGNTYASGDEITGLTEDITITPTWTATSQALTASSTENTVTWSFAKADIVFIDWQSSDKYGYYTLTATVNGETIAVPMQITKGKVGNYGRTDALAQTNQNTQFTIPAVNGMVVEIADAYTAFSTTTIAGSTDYTKSNSNKTITYTYTGSDATIDIVIGESGQYLTSIKVTYPINLTSVDITPAYAKSTYVTAYPLDFSDVKGLKAYVATSANSTAVTMTEVENAVPAGTPLLLIGDADTEYTVPVAASATAPETNLLRAGDGTTEFDGSTYDYILYSDGLFYQIGSGTVATDKAYLHLDSAPSARALSIVFEDETTGISAVESGKLNVEGYYNLAGQRVSQPSKGLYIVNGRKVVVK